MTTLSGFETYYGVSVAIVGDDCDLIALGHHDDRRTIAAFNAHVRDLGFTNLWDYRGHTGLLPDLLKRLDRGMAVVVTRCGACDDDPECGECEEIRRHDWYVQGAAAGHPNAFPVTWWS